MHVRSAPNPTAATSATPWLAVYKKYEGEIQKKFRKKSKGFQEEIQKLDTTENELSVSSAPNARGHQGPVTACFHPQLTIVTIVQPGNNPQVEIKTITTLGKGSYKKRKKKQTNVCFR